MVHHRLSNYLLSLAIAGLGFIANATPIFAHAVETNYELNLLTKELQLTATYSTGEALEWESQTKQLIAYVKLHQFSIGIMFSWLNS
jgi:hypothetical protein